MQIGPNPTPCPKCSRLMEYGECPKGCHREIAAEKCTRCGKTRVQHLHLRSSWGNDHLVCELPTFTLDRL